MTRQPEGKLQERIQAYLRERGAFVFKVHGSEFQEPGLPDLIVCWRGYFIGLEVKQPGEQASARQRLVISKILAAEGTAAVVSSVEEVEAILKRIKRERG